MLSVHLSCKKPSSSAQTSLAMLLWPSLSTKCAPPPPFTIILCELLLCLKLTDHQFLNYLDQSSWVKSQKSHFPFPFFSIWCLSSEAVFLFLQDWTHCCTATWLGNDEGSDVQIEKLNLTKIVCFVYVRGFLHNWRHFWCIRNLQNNMPVSGWEKRRFYPVFNLSIVRDVHILVAELVAHLYFELEFPEWSE